MIVCERMVVVAVVMVAVVYYFTHKASEALNIESFVCKQNLHYSMNMLFLFCVCISMSSSPDE